MVLYDSACNEVYTLDRAKELEKFFVSEHSYTYTLVVECDKLVGKYKIFV